MAPDPMTASLPLRKQTLSPSRSLERVRVRLADGARTTIHVASYPLATTELRVQRLPGLARLAEWCEGQAVADALVAGFYVRSAGVQPELPLTGLPLGELWLDGSVQPFVPFAQPWDRRRASVSVVGKKVRIAPRDELPARPSGDLLQAGPLLVRDGRVVNGDAEGFSAGADQFDSDITVGRHPRAALGCDDERLIALAADGRADEEAGLTIDELAATMASLGAHHALNLDGGGSTSLIYGGRLQNTPREAHEIRVPGGREIATAFVFVSR
jgi:hypothetical protein